MNIPALIAMLLATEDKDKEPLFSVGSIIDDPLLYYGGMAFLVLFIVGVTYYIVTRFVA